MEADSPDPEVEPSGPTPPPRLRTAIYRLRAGYGVPKYELVEVEQLGELVLSRILAENQQSAEVYRPWVASRFTYPLRSLLWQASRNTRGAVILNVLVVAGGFATSGIAVASRSGGKSSSFTLWTVFALGLIVAVAGGMAQLFRPAYRATERTRLSVSLREEGWAFATASGAYAGSVEEALDIFRSKVSEIHQRAAQITALEAATPPAAAGAGRGKGKRTPKPPGASASAGAPGTGA